MKGVAEGFKRLDVSEEALLVHGQELLSLLLADRSANRNIVWATDDYVSLGSSFSAESEITIEAITGNNAGLISPRVAKSKVSQLGRTKGHAEVFTPTWVVNEQNNLVDEAWFGRANVFNRRVRDGWEPTTTKVHFDSQSSRTWQSYVDERRLEIACGEGPYLVSRYDATTGRPLPLSQRVGLLDRKLRVVGQNVRSEEEWLAWSRRAYESTYGFELQGDSLLLARENLLATYIDFMVADLQREPSKLELLKIAEIIAWNLWQMDGVTCEPPFMDTPPSQAQFSIFDTADRDYSPCRIMDWRENETLDVKVLVRGRGNEQPSGEL